MAEAENLSAPAPRLGDILLAEGLLDQSQLRAALRVQRKLVRHRPLGQVLVALGYVRAERLREILDEYGKNAKLGELLVSRGSLDREDLEDALLKKTEGDPRRVGEILIEDGYITEPQLIDALSAQTGAPVIRLDPRTVRETMPRKVQLKFAEEISFVALDQGDGPVTVVTGDPSDDRIRDVAQSLFGADWTLALATPSSIKRCLGEYRAFEERRTVAEAGGNVGAASVVDEVLRDALDANASDIHVEPNAQEVRIRYRIDGSLVHHRTLDLKLRDQIGSRIKVLARMDIAEKRNHQDGVIHTEHDDQAIDLRVSTYVTIHGETATMRILRRQMSAVPLEDIGMSPKTLSIFREEILSVPTGVVIITGPTGSGKTTTLYSALNHCNDLATKIITVEDPVEYQIDGLSQCSVDTRVGRTFDDSLRAIVRQDRTVHRNSPLLDQRIIPGRRASRAGARDVTEPTGIGEIGRA